jgi:hypothetical protein
MRRASRISTGERLARCGVERLEWDWSWVPWCAGRLLSALPITNRKTAYNCPGCIYQTKAIGFLAWVTCGDDICSRSRSRDCVFCVGQDRGFPLDRNASPQPVDREQRGLLRQRLRKRNHNRCRNNAHAKIVLIINLVLAGTRMDVCLCLLYWAPKR